MPPVANRMPPASGFCIAHPATLPAAQELPSCRQRPLSRHYPKPGWVEHGGKEIWASQIGVLAEALGKAGLDATDIAAMLAHWQRAVQTTQLFTAPAE